MQGCSRSHQAFIKNAGFTLVEMVAVIVLLSFGLIAGTQLFTMTAQSYRDTSVRMKQTQDGRFVIERISRELREALPGSLRQTSTANKQCIEWLPIAAASRYLSMPSTLAFKVMEINPDLPSGTIFYAAIFPIETGTGTLYRIPTAGPGSALNLLANPPMSADNADTDIINLQSTPISFPSSSPAERIYILTEPVALCVLDDGRMLRYSNYGFVLQATTLTNTQGVLMAENLLLTDGVPSAGFAVFTASGATMTRNSMVQLDLRMRDPRTQEVLRLQHTVFIRNVP